MTSIIIIIFHYIIASVNSNTHNLLPCFQAVGSGQVKPRILRFLLGDRRNYSPTVSKMNSQKKYCALTWPGVNKVKMALKNNSLEQSNSAI